MDLGASPGARSPVHPEVNYAIGSGCLKGEDVIVTHHCRIWPGSDFNTLPLDLVRASPGGAAVAAVSSSSADEAAAAKVQGASAPASAGGNRLLDLDSAALHGGSAPPRADDFGSEALDILPPSYYSFWAVFDGHNGVAAASMAAEHATEIVEELLPYGPPEPPGSPYYREWCEEVQRALAEAITALNLLFAGRGILAGCTATIVLQVGWLVTCANVGDSRALLDTGTETLTMTVDHRVATHKAERRRVEAMGATIAPIDFSGYGPASNVNNGVGPLRIWPGGLCLSRAVGDFDVGESVIPLPHVCQVVLPPTGARLMVGSDGVWDAFDKMTKVGAMSRSWPLEVCADRLVQTIVRTYGGLRDDTSLIVVDLTPPGKTFTEVVQSLSRKSSGVVSRAALSVAAVAAGGSAARGPRRQRRSGGCLCFGGSAVMEDEEDPRELAPLPASFGTDSPNSSPSVSHRGSRLAVVANYDVAEVMGLMPDRRAEPPGWYGPEVGERLFRMMSESMLVWKDAARNGGSRHGPCSPNPSMHQGGLVAGLLAAGGALANGESGGLRRASSMFFSDAVAEDQDDYGTRFGHYSAQKGSTAAPRFAGQGEASVRGGRGGSDSSTRAGRMWMDPSVRAGRVYFDPSVRAGRAFMDASVRAGKAHLAQQGGSQHGSEPSVRAGRGQLEGSVRGSDEGAVHGGGLLRRASEGAPDIAAEVGPEPQQAGPQLQAQQQLGPSPFGAQQATPGGGSPSAAQAAGRQVADSAQDELGARRKSHEEAIGLAPIRTVRFSGESPAGPRPAKPPAEQPPPLQLQQAGSGPLPSAVGMGAKAVRFALEESPVDHFTLSQASGMLDSVDEDRAS